MCRSPDNNTATQLKSIGNLIFTSSMFISIRNHFTHAGGATPPVTDAAYSISSQHRCATFFKQLFTRKQSTKSLSSSSPFRAAGSIAKRFGQSFARNSHRQFRHDPVHGGALAELVATVGTSETNFSALAAQPLNRRSSIFKSLHRRFIKSNVSNAYCNTYCNAGGLPVASAASVLTNMNAKMTTCKRIKPNSEHLDSESVLASSYSDTPPPAASVHNSAFQIESAVRADCIAALRDAGFTHTKIAPFAPLHLRQPSDYDSFHRSPVFNCSIAFSVTIPTENVK
ncbi:hypothetical protein V1512DRAFT_261117 [Lipomyces arxii]|uniref:uncharacterized protein n=1 Tax=Lipomyces arxii TaxID=56418 RepID=UPI0034CF6498